jgi:hypothetical protein
LVPTTPPKAFGLDRLREIKLRVLFAPVFPLTGRVVNPTMGVDTVLWAKSEEARAKEVIAEAKNLWLMFLLLEYLSLP